MRRLLFCAARCLLPFCVGCCSVLPLCVAWSSALAARLVASRCCHIVFPQGLPWSGNSSAQTSASLHPPAALRLRVLPFTRTWSSTVCAEEFPTPLEMSLHGLNLLRHSKSFSPGAPIAYATSVSPPDEAVAWPGCRCWMLDMAVAWPGATFLQITARANPCSRHLWGTLARAVASI